MWQFLFYLDVSIPGTQTLKNRHKAGVSISVCSLVEDVRIKQVEPPPTCEERMKLIKTLKDMAVQEGLPTSPKDTV